MSELPKNNDAFLGGNNLSSSKENADYFNGKPSETIAPDRKTGFLDMRPNKRGRTNAFGYGSANQRPAKKLENRSRKTQEKELIPEAETKPVDTYTENNILEEVPEQRKTTRMSYDQIADELMEAADFCRIDGLLHYYDEQFRCWKMVTEIQAKTVFRKIAPDWLRSNINNRSIDEAYNWIVNESKEVTDAELSKRKQYLNFQDGAVNWQTMERVKEAKELYFQYVLKCEIPDFSYCKTVYEESQYKKYMQSLFANDPEEQKIMEQVIGIICSHIRDKKLSAFLYGPSNTGKSVLLNLMEKIVGREFTSSISFSQMSEEFAVAQMCGKWLNISGEISGATNKRLDTLKSLTGNDPVTVSFKGKDHFPMYNKAFLLFACNLLPKIDVESVQSVFERILIFDCSNAIDRSEWCDNLADILYAESDIVMYRAIKGLRNLNKNNFMIQPTEVMKRKKEQYLLEYNSFIAFAQKYLEKDADGEEASCTIQEYYHVFCQQNDVKPLAMNIWTQELQKMFPVKKGNITKRERQPGVPYNARGYKGITLVNTESLLEEVYPPELFNADDDIGGDQDDE